MELRTKRQSQPSQSSSRGRSMPHEPSPPRRPRRRQQVQVSIDLALSRYVGAESLFQVEPTHVPPRGTRRHRLSLRDARIRVRLQEGSVSAFVSSRPIPSTPLLVTPDQREDLSRYYPCVTQTKKAQPTKSIEPCIYWSGSLDLNQRTPDPQFERLPSGYVHHGLLLRDSTIHIPAWSVLSTGVHSVSCQLSCQLSASLSALLIEGF